LWKLIYISILITQEGRGWKHTSVELNLFYGNLILEIWTSFRSFILDIHFKLPFLISIFHNTILLFESFIYEEHYIKVYWVHLIYLWLNRCFCTTLKVHNKLNFKDLTMKLMFQCMSSLLTWVSIRHLHISIGINYYWKFKNCEKWIL
jgi:hypothetical protein